MESLIRVKKVEDRTGLKKSMIYDLVGKGELCPPVKIGERAVAWIESEIDVINAARIAGHSNDKIRELVKTLMAKRQQFTDDILTLGLADA